MQVKALYTAAILAWLFLSLPCIHCQNNDNWFPTIFYGQNQPPEETITDVWMDAHLWRLNSVDEINYQFAAHLRYTLTWQDPRAAEQVANATARQREAGEPCRRPCDNSNFPAGNPNVQLPQLDTSSLCCEDIFLPTLLTDSVLEFSSGNYYSRVLVLDGGYVSWSVKVLATYYTSLSFRAYPFDRQRLTILFRLPELPEYANGRVLFHPSTAAISQRFQQGLEHGDELANYYINSVYFDVFREPWDRVYRDFTVFPTAPSNPSGNVAAQRLSSEYVSLSVVIEVYRYSLYHCFVSILPTGILGLLGVTIFHFAPSQVEVRVQCIFSLLLGLLALQYVMNATLPSSSYILPTQQFIVATYALYLCLMLESFYVYRMCTVQQRQEDAAQQRQALERYHQQKHKQHKTRLRGVFQCGCCTKSPPLAAPSSNKCMLLQHPTVPSTQHHTIAFTKSTGIPIATPETPFATSTISTPPAATKSIPYTSPWEHHTVACITPYPSVCHTEETLRDYKMEAAAQQPSTCAESVSRVPSSVAVQVHDGDTAAMQRGCWRWWRWTKEKESKEVGREELSLCQWRARRVDKRAAVVLLVVYCVVGVLLFVLPVVQQAKNTPPW